MRTIDRAKLRWRAAAVAAIALILSAFAAFGGLPTGEGVAQQEDAPIPVESDGGIGDTPRLWSRTVGWVIPPFRHGRRIDRIRPTPPLPPPASI